jgi:flagellar biosynthesis chaperone FliJ
MSNDVSDLRRFFANLDSEINTVERNVARARQEVERATGSLQQSRSKRDDM